MKKKTSEEGIMEQKENKNPSTHVLEFSGEPGIMKGKTTGVLAFFNRGFGAKAVCSDTTKTSGQL